MFLKAEEPSPQDKVEAGEGGFKDLGKNKLENKINEAIESIDLTKDSSSQESELKEKNDEISSLVKKKTELTLCDGNTGNALTTGKSLLVLSPTEKRTLIQMHRLWEYLPELQNFTMFRKIGEGTFSSVYLACLKGNPEKKYAIKHHVPTALPSRIAWEYKCLKDIGGVDNVGGIETAFRRNDCTVFVMPYLPHARFSDYVLHMGVDETRDYLRSLLVALARVHSFGVIHRDVKPSNYLYNRDARKYMLVDFGLACTTLEPALVATGTPPTAESYKRKREGESPDANAPKRRADHVQARSSGGGAPQISANHMQTRSNEGTTTQTSAKQGEAQVAPAYEDSVDMWKGASQMSPQLQASVKKQLFASPAASCARLSCLMQARNPTARKPTASRPANPDTPRPRAKPIEGVRDLKAEMCADAMRADCKENGPPLPRETGRGDPRKAVLGCIQNTGVASTATAFSRNNAAAAAAAAALAGNRFHALTQSAAADQTLGTSYLRVQDSKVKARRERQTTRLLASPPPESPACLCYARGRVCIVCLARPGKLVPRAGTPGFRPPEVLFKYPHQTTAVDMWAAGVVLLCVMSGCYPFFKSPNDISALAEITVVFGSDRVKEIAAKLGRQVQFSATKRPLNMRRLCEALRRRGQRQESAEGSPQCPECMQFEHPVEGCLCDPVVPGGGQERPDTSGDSSGTQESDTADWASNPVTPSNNPGNPSSRTVGTVNKPVPTESTPATPFNKPAGTVNNVAASGNGPVAPGKKPAVPAASDCMAFPAEAYDLLARLMDLNPFTRISAADALRHPFFTGCSERRAARRPEP